MQTQQHIFLVGFMGSGKTYWGRLLADEIGLPFLDLDDYVSRVAGESIPAIFSRRGEMAFRILERDALRQLTAMPPLVAATGGGTPCFFGNMDWMNASGITVYLQTPPSVLAERLRPEMSDRPLLAGLAAADLPEFIARKLTERAPFYLQSKIIIAQPEHDTPVLKKLAPHLSVERQQ
ncbi:MAG: shikimate kinase [Saprospiraceae bacterium]|nr:shikimate kinase [Saprospiraceae bacterium]